MPKIAILDSEGTCFTLFYTMIAECVIQEDTAPSWNAHSPAFRSTTRKRLAGGTG